jgi:DNA-binding NarL/FixJ family response regulator
VLSYPIASDRCRDAAMRTRWAPTAAEEVVMPYAYDAQRSRLDEALPGFEIPEQRVPAETGDELPSAPVGPMWPESLNDRDIELLRRLAESWSTGRIAAAMSVSSNTARTRIRRVSRKLEVGDRQGLAEAARGLMLG